MIDAQLIKHRSMKIVYMHRISYQVITKFIRFAINHTRFNTATRPFMEFTEKGPVAGENLRHEFCAVYAENARRQLR